MAQSLVPNLGICDLKLEVFAVTLLSYKDPFNLDSQSTAAGNHIAKTMGIQGMLLDVNIVDSKAWRWSHFLRGCHREDDTFGN